jgi:hypothetical protein
MDVPPTKRPESLQRSPIDLSLIDDSPELERCLEDWLDLHRGFASACDLGQVRFFLAKLSNAPESVSRALLGSGTHFSTYLIDSSDHRMKLTVKVSHPSFCRETIDRDKYRRSIAKLRTLHEVSLVPPIETLDIGEKQIALVMPYAKQSWTEAAQHWQPLRSWIEHSLILFDQLDLVLNDIPQVRCVNGIPMMVDLSDLIPKNTSDTM